MIFQGTVVFAPEELDAFKDAINNFSPRMYGKEDCREAWALIGDLGQINNAKSHNIHEVSKAADAALKLYRSACELPVEVYANYGGEKTQFANRERLSKITDILMEARNTLDRVANLL